MSGELLRICAVGILCAVTSLLLKQLRGDFAAPVRIAACVLIFGWVIPTAWQVANDAFAFLDAVGVESYASVMLRALGLALLTRICADICRDCGENGTAGGVELAGKVGILSLCIPLMGEIVGYATEFLQME